MDRVGRGDGGLPHRDDALRAGGYKVGEGAPGPGGNEGGVAPVRCEFGFTGMHESLAGGGERKGLRCCSYEDEGNRKLHDSWVLFWVRCGVVGFNR